MSDLDKEKTKRLKSAERLSAIVETPMLSPKINKKSAAIVRDKKASVIVKPEQKPTAAEKTLPKVSDKYLLQKY